MATITRKPKRALDEGEIPGAKPRARKSRDELETNGHQADVSKSIERREARSFAEEAECEQTCRTCGCTHRDPCQEDGDACAWVAGDPTLCTACEELGPLLASDRDAAIRKFLAPATDDDKALLRSLNGRPLSREEVMEWDFDWLPASALIDYRVRRTGLAVKAPNRGGIVPWEEVVEHLAGEGGPSKQQTTDDTEGTDERKPERKRRTSNVEHPTSNGEAKANGSIVDHLKQREPIAAGGELRSIGVDDLVASPYQTRQDFGTATAGRPCDDQAGLDELAASIKEHGVLQPIVVRPISLARAIGGGANQHYELVAGERRWRAAKLAGLAAVPAIVRTLSDAEACAIVLVENLQRKDLNAIEQARGFQRSLEVLGCTQADLAKRVGCTPSAISNALRLLEAPAKWLDRVVSGEMPPTFLRPILEWVQVPALEKALDKEWMRIRKRDGEGLTREEWTDEAEETVNQATGALQDETYDTKAGRRLEVLIEPTDTEREQLGLIKLPTPDWQRRQGAPEFEERATNRKLHKQLWDKAIAAARLAATTKAEKKEKGQAKKERKLSPAEVKAKAEQRRQQLQGRLHEWRTDWLRMLIAPRLNFSQEARVGNKLLLWLATNREGYQSDRDGVLAGVLGVKAHGLSAAWDRLHNSDDAHQVFDWLLAFCRGLFWDEKDLTARREIPADIVEDLVVELEIDLAACWDASEPEGKHQACAGPLTRRLYELHDRADLEELAKQLGVNAFGAKTKEAVVQMLLNAPAAGKRLPLPKCIKPLKGAKPAKVAKKKGAKR